MPSGAVARQVQRGPSVLIVHDRPDFRRQMRQLLEREGFVIVGEAENGWQAVSRAEQLSPDVILINENGSSVSGVDATRLIRQKLPQVRILIVGDDLSRAQESLGTYGEVYFVKEADLLNVLRTLRGGRSAPQPRPEGATRKPSRGTGRGIAIAAVGVGILALLIPLLLSPLSFLPAVALICGLFFFLYGLKYYLSVVMLLISSANGNGNGYAHGNGNGNGRGLANGNGNGKTRLGHQPFIAIHLPLYNEKEVVDRLLTACTSLEYENYEVVVADDSTDETTRILKERWGSHPKVKISHREDRSGFKGAALDKALERTDPRAKFIAVFDADFIPPPDILHQFLSYFYGTNGSNGEKPKHDDQPPRLVDPRVAAVQGYQWHILNASQNWITKGIRSEFSGSYVIERSGQELTGGMKMIAGSVFMIRTDALKEVGWRTSITEDWELTLRLYLRGYKVLYTPFIQAPAECVADFKQLVKQRMRWAEGHTFNIKRYFTRVLASARISLREKLEFLYYTPYYLQSAFFMIGTACWLVTELILKVDLPFWTELLGWALVFANTLSLLLMNLTGLFLERGVRRNWTGLLSFMLLTYLLVPYQAYAAIKGLFEPHEGGWHRTQKTGVITEVVDKLSLGKRMRSLLPRKRRGSVDLGGRLGLEGHRFTLKLPERLRRFSGRTSIGFRLAGGMVTFILLLLMVSTTIPVATAAPDVFYLHDTATSGISPAGKEMDNTVGPAGSTLTFDTAGQDAYWYVDQTWPTGGDDASIAAGDYTLNMYFSSLPATWYDTDWLYRKKITIQSSEVTADLSYFPVLINLGSDANLSASAQSDGGDILFTSSDGTTKLDHEIERYTSATGELVAWVEVPSLSSTVNTELYMYYGNATAADQWNISGTWDDGGAGDFRGVWHLPEDPSAAAPQFLNSATANFDGTANSLTSSHQVPGQIDGSLAFDDTNERHVDVPDSAGLQLASDITFSAWVQTTDTDPDVGVVAAKWGPSGDRNYWLGKLNDTDLSFFVDDTQSVSTGLASVNDGAWHHVVGVADSAGTSIRIFVDGAQQNTAAYSGTSETGTGDLHIGNSPDTASQEFDGGIDEVRVAATARSADWIATEFNNQSSPSTFYSLDAEETAPYVNITVTVSHTASDGSGATTIVQSSTTKIDANTANPLALSIGSGAEETFTSADPRRVRLQIHVDSVSGGGSFALAYDSDVDPTNLETPVVTVPETGALLLVLVPLVPYLMSLLWRRRRLAWRLISLLLAVSITIGILAGQVVGVQAAPDVFYFHNTATSGITPAGEYMNTTEGTGGSTTTFDTVGQNEYWYVDETWPTGNDDASIAAGNYTANLYFNSLPSTQTPAVDAVSTGKSGATSVTVSHTTSGSNRLMLVGVSINNDESETVSSVTYDGSSLSLVGTATASDDARVEIWSLVAPSTGTHDVVVTFNAKLTRNAIVGVATFNDVDQTTPLGTYAGDRGTSNKASVSVSSSNGELVFDTVACETCTSLTVGNQQTERWNLSEGGGSVFGGGSTAAGKNNVNMSWDLGSSDHWAHGAVPIKPSGGSAPTVDAVSTGTSGTNSMTLSHTTSGSQRLMLVGISLVPDQNETVSSVTYNGTGLTQVGTATESNDARIEIWQLVAPDTGTHDLVINFSANLHEQAATGVATFTGVDQTTPLGTFAGNNGNSAGPATVDVTSATNELVFDTAACQACNSLTVGAGQTERWNLSVANNIGAGSTEPGASTVTMSWSLGTSQPWAIGAVPIKPATASVDITVSVHHTKADGSDPQLITSASTTIDSGTADPLALDLGSAAEQTFTSADPRRLRLQISVDSVSGGGDFILDYDGACASDLCSNLNTPVVTVPEFGLVFLPLVVLAPVAAGRFLRRRRRVGSTPSEHRAEGREGESHTPSRTHPSKSRGR